jgi:hypothetical protein
MDVWEHPLSGSAGCASEQSRSPIGSARTKEGLSFLIYSSELFHKAARFMLVDRYSRVASVPLRLIQGDRSRRTRQPFFYHMPTGTGCRKEVFLTGKHLFTEICATIQ